MRILAIMPDVDGIQIVLDDIKKQLGCEELDLRTNFNAALKAVKGYDAIIVHQNSTSISLTADDFGQVQDLCTTDKVIPLINTQPGSELVQRLFSIGLYNSIYQNESSADNIVKLIKESRNRKDAKEYYGITNTNIAAVSEHILSDSQVKRTIDFLRASSDVEEGFNTMISNLSTPQKLYLIQQLPDDLKETLKSSDAYVSYERMISGQIEKQKPIILEQTIEKETVIEKTEIIQNHTKKRQLFTIYGNSELCAEMATVAAKNSSEAVLIIDVETIVPDIHYVLGLKQTVNDGVSIGNLVSESSFLQAYEIAAGKSLNYDILQSIAVQCKPKNLFILTGSDNVSKHETFTFEPLRRIIDISLDIYGAVFVNIPNNIYNALALYMIVNPKSTLIMPFNGGAVDLRNKMKHIELVRNAQNIQLKNVKYLAFDYHSTACIDESDIRQITQGMYIGKISHDIGRIKSRNDFRDGYSNNMPKKIEEEYKKILSKFGLATKDSFSRRVGRLFERSK